MRKEKITTDIVFRGNAFPGSWFNHLHAFFPLVRAKRSDPPFHTWFRVLTPRYQIWMSDPIIIRNDTGIVEWAVRFQREASCHPEGLEVYDGLISMTIKELPGSFILTADAKAQR
jgi:hypothetical protein